MVSYRQRQKNTENSAEPLTQLYLMNGYGISNKLIFAFLQISVMLIKQDRRQMYRNVKNPAIMSELF